MKDGHFFLWSEHTVPSHGKNLFFDFQIEAWFLVLMKEDMINFWTKKIWGQ